MNKFAITFCTECSHKEGKNWYDMRCTRNPKINVGAYKAAKVITYSYCAQKNNGECPDYEPSRSYLETSVRG